MSVPKQPPAPSSWRPMPAASRATALLIGVPPIRLFACAPYVPGLPISDGSSGLTPGRCFAPARLGWSPPHLIVGLRTVPSPRAGFRTFEQPRAEPARQRRPGLDPDPAFRRCRAGSSSSAPSGVRRALRCAAARARHHWGPILSRAVRPRHAGAVGLSARPVSRSFRPERPTRRDRPSSRHECHFMFGAVTFLPA
jgi:hypothetical protein